MRQLGQIGQYGGGICAHRILRFKFGQGGGHIAAHQHIEQVEYATAIGQPEQPAHILFAQRRVAIHMRKGAVEQRQRITRRAVSGARHQFQHLIRQRHGLGRTHFFEQFLRVLHAEAVEVETLAARQHRDRHLTNFRCRENKLHISGRLFQRLQQPVKGGLGQHVHFVNNIDLIARRGRHIAHILNDFANIINAGARRGIHLNDIDMGAVHNRFAMRAGLAQRHAWHVRRIGVIVQSARKNTRRGGFADTAHTRQHKGMRNTARVKGVFQRLHHGLLAN